MRAATQTGGRDATTRRISGDFALCVGEPVLPAPPGWRWFKLTDVARLESGHTPSRKHPEYWGGHIPWITLSDARAHDGGVIFDTIEQTNELGIANSSARMLPAGTVCLSRTASVGYVVVTGRPMATSQDFVNWVCSEKLDPHFLRYLLIAERRSLGRFSSGAVHQTIYFPEVKAFHICLPPVHEQKRIVAILDEALEGIRIATANAEKNLANARELFDVALNDHFEAPGGRPVRLDEICAIVSPLVDPRDPKYRELPHIGAGNVESKTGRLRDVLSAEAEGLKSGKFPFDDRMILYSKIRPYLEKVVRPDFEGLCSADMYPLLPRESAIARNYLYYLLLSGRFTRYAIAGSARAGMPKVNREHLFAYDFQLPSMDIQQRVADVLDAVREQADQLISLQGSKLGELLVLKRSILARAFSGQLTAARERAA